jgi:uncharacterized protein (DUF2141 family)
MATINAGAVTRQDFDINSKEGNAVTGTVAGLNEKEGSRIIALPGAVEVPTRLSQPLLKDLENQSVSEARASRDHPQFSLEGLNPGDYTIVACAVTGGQVDDILDWRIASGLVTVKNGQENRIDFDLTGAASPPANIVGTLAGVDPGADAVVAVVRGNHVLPNPPDESSIVQLRKNFITQVHWKEGESFQFKHLDPGLYTVVAFSDGNDDKDTQRGCGSSLVEVVKDQPTQIDLRMEHLKNAPGNK